MRRRGFLQGLGLATGLAMPATLRAAGQTTLRFVPQTDLTLLDPIVTTAFVTRNHAYMVFDTLYGMDANFQPQPQMVAGHRVENDGLLWELTLREGLSWHDGTPVLARDCVASIRRWARRDPFGAGLMAATDELAAVGDSVIRFRLSRPFPMLPSALGKTTTPMCAMMPEHLASTDPFREVPEMVGSGPFRFLADERIPGARNAYARFERYRPRADGAPDWTAGPKLAHFDRIEWNTLPDVGTAAAALRAGEQDWLAYVSPDLAPTLRRQRSLRVARLDQTGMMNFLQLNHLQPPFDNPAIRRALLGAIDQTACMQAIVGDDPAAYHAPLGFFCPGTPMASEEGLEAFAAPRDMGAVRAALRAAGYGGERVVLMVPVDNPPLQALGEVAADTLKRAGFNLDVQAMDFGTMLARRLRTEPVQGGGWSAFVSGTAGTDWLNPAWHALIRGTGRAGSPGWSSSERREALRASWLDASDDSERRRLCAALQRQCFEEVPYVPLGQYFQAVAYRSNLTGMLNGFPTFWGVRPA